MNIINKTLIVSALLGLGNSYAEENCNTNTIIPYAITNIVADMQKVKTTGSAIVTRLDGWSLCGYPANVAIDLHFHFPKTVTLEKAIKVFSDSSFNNMVQTKYEKDKNPPAKQVKLTKTQIDPSKPSDSTYYLDGESHIMFGSYDLKTKKIRTKCNETTVNHVWSRNCNVVMGYESGSSTFSKNSFSNECKETASGVVCHYTQDSSLKNQCQVVNSGTDIAKMVAERSVYIQTTLAEMVAQGDDRTDAQAAYDAMKSSNVYKAVTDVKTNNIAVFK